MTGGGDQGPEDQGAAGGPARHIPVLREEVLAALLPSADSGGLFLDGTFGAGGYTAAILARPETRVLALDRDPTAIAGGAQLVDKFGDRLRLVEGRFADLAAIAAAENLGPFDGICFDVGVSSMQIDQADRGFSFMRDGPLDMRMDMGGMGNHGTSAADILAEASDEVLADILYHFGEERQSRRIARAIVHDREATPFTSTRQLAELLARLVPTKPTDIHPATRTFQALRIAVNDELGELVHGLAAAERMLKPGGRLAIVSFHSLEDRIVKQFLARRAGRGEAKGRRLPGEPAATLPSFTLPKGQPIVPGEAEAKSNPRARSAKLRTGLRTDNPALPLEPELVKLATLPHRAAPRSGKPR